MMRKWWFKRWTLIESTNMHLEQPRLRWKKVVLKKKKVSEKNVTRSYSMNKTWIKNMYNVNCSDSHTLAIFKIWISAQKTRKKHTKLIHKLDAHTKSESEKDERTFESSLFVFFQMHVQCGRHTPTPTPTPPPTQTRTRIASCCKLDF